MSKKHVMKCDMKSLRYIIAFLGLFVTECNADSNMTSKVEVKIVPFVMPCRNKTVVVKPKADCWFCHGSGKMHNINVLCRCVRLQRRKMLNARKVNEDGK